ncbi:hypothetical protein ANOM_005471 [Aspergillus nomiae NRRL 13137]|uniref:Xylanolytic transcriptional activator regulatory domain-containing protein n=1 Tax=Aspergillus nomiae NRRL (strain ATCC 15546 / NRRL 13137 / CBS 260.88 / M93) TaxID=1509407 RepID=A0A0L1J308_ASPN3|nr:uncharacterized protein ANOM_005471 [Aspergillus nomiae NRRL 13137]KNG86122.1 hypothetical protein ANOM_005471 [Aspergillus nomiae NRRL 13137]
MLEAQVAWFKTTLIQMKDADVQTRALLLREALARPNVPLHHSEEERPKERPKERRGSGQMTLNEDLTHTRSLQKPPTERCKSVSSDDELETSTFVSADDQGRIGVFGPTSGLHNSLETSQLPGDPPEFVRNLLITNAVIQRQKEYELRNHADFDGVPPDLAMHLLDVHWNRQHHSFLLTYRPAFTRDWVSGGPYFSRFLLNAIFASGSKFSGRTEVRDDPSLAQTAGNRSCGGAKNCLLHLGSVYVARGEMSKSWINTGLAIRMAFDLGLHLDTRVPDLYPEDVEIRRRAFWAAFISDKLQCLYFGRPVAIHLRDTHVSTKLRDTMEELECWSPYIDPQCSTYPIQSPPPVPTFMISAFQQFCLLSNLMADIINHFYVVGAKPATPQITLQELDDALCGWYFNLPDCVAFQPWSTDKTTAQKLVTPNIMILHSTYHALIILLHRPFVSNSNLRAKSPPVDSWRACSTAASRITAIIERWKESFALYKAPYLLGYCAYVACTIHVRDAALHRGGQSHNMLTTTLSMLNEISSVNPALTRSEQLVRNLMAVNAITELSHPSPVASSSTVFDVDMEALIQMFPDPLDDQLVDLQVSSPNFSQASFLGSSSNTTVGLQCEDEVQPDGVSLE